MDLRALSDFLCLAETRNFREAAEMRNITVSGLSRRIKALEQWVGAELVDRGASPIALTEAGEEVRRLAVEIVGHLNTAGERSALSLSPALLPPRTVLKRGPAPRPPATGWASIEETRPTIAIAPFHCLSHNAAAADCARALGDALAVHLGQAPYLDLRRRAEDADYLIDGSLAADELSGRVTLQIAHAPSGRLILSRRYTLRMARFTGDTDGIAGDFAWTICRRIRRRIFDKARRLKPRDRSNFETYMVVHETVARPGFGAGAVREALGLLAERERATHWVDHLAGMVRLMDWGRDPTVGAHLEAAAEHGERAVEEAPDFHPGQMLRSLSAAMRHDFPRAREALDQVFRIAPDDAMNLLPAGVVALSLGETERALSLLRRSARVEPGWLWYSPIYAAVALYQLGRYADAAAEIDLRRSPFPDAIAIRLAALAQIDALDEATLLKAARGLMPSSLRVFYLQRFPFADKAATGHLLDGLRKARIEEISV